MLQKGKYFTQYILYETNLCLNFVSLDSIKPFQSRRNIYFQDFRWERLKVNFEKRQVFVISTLPNFLDVSVSIQQCNALYLRKSSLLFFIILTFELECLACTLVLFSIQRGCKWTVRKTNWNLKSAASCTNFGRGLRVHSVEIAVGRILVFVLVGLRVKLTQASGEELTLICVRLRRKLGPKRGQVFLFAKQTENFF